MPVTLPDDPAPNGVTATLMDYGGIIRPATGGAAQRIDRAGSRFRMDFTFPPMPSAETGRVFVSRLLRAKSEGIRIEFPLASSQQGAPGVPLVNGAGQSGTTIVLDGLAPYYLAREGYWLSISNGTRLYLHNVTAPAAADGSGNMTLAITPALRFPFADNAVVELAHPIVDGFVVGEEWAWQLDLAHHIGLSVTVEEWG